MLVVSESSVFLAVAIAFALIAHPSTYLIVHKFSKKISGPNVVTPYGVSTTTGLLIHALVAPLIAIIVLRFF
jgi:hypothetical protein